MDLDEQAREIIDTNRYLVLGTVDDDGTPRVSPVFYGVDRYRDFFWVSHPSTHHGDNLARAPRVAATIFDSTRPTGQGQAVYLTGRARQVPDDELADRLGVAFRPDVGGRAFGVEELTGDADLRLYVLTAETCEVNVPAGDPALGTGRDRRVGVAIVGL